MKKILLVTGVLLLSLLNIALAEDTASPFPNAKKGINIIPIAKINLSPEMKKHILKNKISIVNNGYEDTSETDESVISLFALEKNAREEIKKFDNDKNPYDTHLKSSLSKINLAFNLKGIPRIDTKNVIGYAAVGGYVKANGWDGFVEFISDKNLGICSYTTYKIEKVILDKETTEYLVNGKASNKSIAGNLNTGFLYTLNWYTDERLYTFVCANKSYKEDVISKMMSMARVIDKL
jgi:hypothetical protein